MANLSRIFYSIIVACIMLAAFSSSYAQTTLPSLETQLKQAQSPQEVSSIIIQHCAGLTEPQIFDLLKNNADFTSLSVCWLNTDNVFIGLNQRAINDLNIASAAVYLGKKIYDLYPREMAEYLSADNRRVMQTGEGAIQHGGAVKDFVTGEIEYYTIVKTPLRNEKGEIFGIMGVSVPETH